MTEAHLTIEEKNFLSYVDNKLSTLDFRPLSDSELLETRGKYEGAITNAMLEGIYESKFEGELNCLFIKHQAPHDLRHQFILESIDAGV